MVDLIEKTKQSYIDPEGARAFVNKELKTHDDRADAVFSVVDDIDFTDLKVLDVGCGYGRDVMEFRNRGADAYGVDVSPSLLAHAEGDKAWFQVHDLLGEEPVPFNIEFDFIWNMNVFVHVPHSEFQRVLSKMWHKLKVGGQMVVMTKDGQGQKLNDGLGQNLERLMVYYNENMLREAFERLGAEIQEVFVQQPKYGENRIVIKARKVS